MAADGPGRPDLGDPESLAEVLASIRALVSAETAARSGDGGAAADVLMLTPDMRVAPAASGPARSGEVLAAGLERVPARTGQGAPILDEEALRGVINAIVREELQGELGDRISRNLRKLIRRELADMLEKREDDADRGDPS